MSIIENPAIIVYIDFAGGEFRPAIQQNTGHCINVLANIESVERGGGECHVAEKWGRSTSGE